MTAVEAAVRPTKAAVRISRYFSDARLRRHDTSPEIRWCAYRANSVSASRRERRELVSSTASIVSSEGRLVTNGAAQPGSTDRPRGFDFSGVSCDGTACRQRSKSAGFPARKASTPRLKRAPISSDSCFFPPSPRNVVARARGGARGTRPRQGADRGADRRRATTRFFAASPTTLQPDLLQLHGKETPERVSAIRAMTGVPVMKAIGVAATRDLAAIAELRDADRLLLDAKPPRDATRPGGHGVAFDWTILRRLRVAETVVPLRRPQAEERRRGARRRRARRASTSRPASRARRAERTRPASTPSSRPCATSTGPATAQADGKERAA